MADNTNLINQGQPAQPNSALPDRQGQAGTGFTNISRIVNANQNNQLGSTINSRINSDVNKTKDNINQTKTQFDNEADKTRQGIQSGQQFAQGAIQNAGSGQFSGADQAKFNNVYQGNYSGPTSVQNIDQLQNQANNVQNIGNMTTSAGGRQALLQRYAGAPSYTQGQQSVDNLLLGQTGQQALHNARSVTAGLGAQVGTLAQGANAQIQGLQNQTQELAKNTQAELTGAQTNQAKSIDDTFQNAEDLEKNRIIKYNQVISDDHSGNSLNSNYGNNWDIGNGLGFYNGGVNSFGNGSFKSDTTKDLSQLEDLKNSNYISNNTFNQLTNLFNSAKKVGDQVNHTSAYNDQSNPRGMEAYNQLYDQYRDGTNLTSELLKSLKTTDAQNLTRNSVASDQQIARVNALSKLSKGTDMMSSNRPTYQAGTQSTDEVGLLKSLGITINPDGSYSSF